MNEDSNYRKGYKDGLKYAIVLARSFGIEENYVKKLEAEYLSQDNRRAIRFEYGYAYILYEKSNVQGLEIVEEMAGQGIRVIIVSRDLRSDLKRFPNVRTALITYEEGGFNPNQMSQIQEFVVNNLEERSVLYIDCIDYILSTSNSPH
ncbi:MAG: DUF835 domain-containing protein, partial [Thermoplasmatales archaeon]